MDSGILVMLILLGFIAVLILAALFEVRTVDQGEQIVVNEMGRVRRVSGPGPVVLMRGRDKVARTIDCRNRKKTMTVSDYINGIPFDYTLEFWCRTDLNRAAQVSGMRLDDLAVFDDHERDGYVRTKVRAALQEGLRVLEDAAEPAESATQVDRLLPVLPAVPSARSLLSFMTEELKQTLPTVGVLFSPEHPLAITDVRFNEDVTGSLSRGHVVKLMREQFPDMTPDMLMQTLMSINGIDVPKIERLLFGAGDSAQVGVRVRDGEVKPQANIYPGLRPQRGDPGVWDGPMATPLPDETPAPQPLPTMSPPIPPRDDGVLAEQLESDENLRGETLTPADLVVLKRVPPFDDSAKAA